MSPRRVVLLLAFFGSGLAALVFELSWTRLLLLSLGTTATAVGVVLGAFMGGMALGAAASTHPILAKRDPVYCFAALELFIGLYALTSPTVLHAVGGIPGAELRFVLALLSLLPATVAMGASLPVLVRAFAHDRLAIGLGQLYAVNTAGAVMGPLLAVFWLYPSVGLLTTLWIGAGIDFAVAGALALWRRSGASSPAVTEPEVELAPEEASSDPSPLGWPVLVAVSVSGASAMVYEVAWSRTLSMVYGSSVYGVSIMLSTFLFGLTIGAFLATVFLRRRPEGDALARVAKALMASSILAFVSLIVARGLPFLFLNFYSSVTSEGGMLSLSQFAVAMLLMLPSSAALGATLPLAADVIPKDAFAGRKLARLYSFNLVGSALGAVAASGLLLASLGVDFTVRLAAIACLLIAAAVLAQSKSFSVPAGAVAGSAVLVMLALDPGGEQTMKSFGMYSGVQAYSRYNPSELRTIVDAHDLLYYRDGPTATVAVQQIKRFKLLKINGKTDASNGPGDMSTQLLMGHFPFLAIDAKRVAVLGWGSGSTVGAVLQHPVESVDAFEIEPAVVEASRFFEPENGEPLDDERLNLVLGDARSELRRGEGLYDLIISQPSNPWLTGVANLFTLDFFEILDERLAPNGILCQWFQLYGMSEESARSLIATFRQVFPHVIAFKDRDLVLIGSRNELRFSLERLRELYQSSQTALSLQAAKMPYPADLLASMRLDSEGTKAFSEGARINTDDNMYIELKAPRSLYQDEVEAILESMGRYPPDIFAHLDTLGDEASTRLELAASLFTAGKYERALEQANLAAEKRASFEVEKLRGQILERLGRSDEAKQALEKALATGGDVVGRRFVEAMLRSLESPSGP